MYDEVYAEWLVKCKKPVYITLLKVLVCILLVLSILAMLIVWFGFIFVLVFALAFYALNLMGNKEYEYIFVAGELDIDRILGAQNRKRKLKLSMDDMELVAPWNASELAGFKGKQGMKITDYSSQTDPSKNYGIVGHKDGETKLIVFEPNEKMIQEMKRCAPRKVIVAQA